MTSSTVHPPTRVEIWPNECRFGSPRRIALDEDGALTRLRAWGGPATRPAACSVGCDVRGREPSAARQLLGGVPGEFVGSESASPALPAAAICAPYGVPRGHGRYDFLATSRWLRLVAILTSLRD
jgi:hypothetical protein